MTKTIHGKVHGKIIELDEDLGVADGQDVEVQVKAVSSTTTCEGFRRCAGALADIPGLDEHMEQILRERKTDRFRDVPE